MDYLATRSDIDQRKVVFFGRSLGGAVAVRTAVNHRHRVAALVLENTFTSISDMVDHVMPLFAKVGGGGRVQLAGNGRGCGTRSRGGGEGCAAAPHSTQRATNCPGAAVARAVAGGPRLLDFLASFASSLCLCSSSGSSCASGGTRRPSSRGWSSPSSSSQVRHQPASQPASAPLEQRMPHRRRAFVHRPLTAAQSYTHSHTHRCMPVGAGTEDKLVPPPMMRRLHKAATASVGKHFVSVQGGEHNDTFQKGEGAAPHRLTPLHPQRTRQPQPPPLPPPHSVRQAARPTRAPFTPSCSGHSCGCWARRPGGCCRFERAAAARASLPAPRQQSKRCSPTSSRHWVTAAVSPPPPPRDPQTCSGEYVICIIVSTDVNTRTHTPVPSLTPTPRGAWARHSPRRASAP